MDLVREFLTRVVAWPADEESAGFVNLHWSGDSRTEAGKKYWTGKPYRNVDQFLSMAHWLTTRAIPSDIYLCMSLQAKTFTDRSGKVKAERLHENALALKAIWLDLDVKPDAYPSVERALAALVAFIKVTGLPLPSALVGSGGGVHVYWISDRPLAPNDWQPYADGLKALVLTHALKCDVGCTVDRVRILRVPGTFNLKITPRRPVKILGPLGLDYDFAAVLGFLTKLAPVIGTGGTSSNALAGKPSPAFAALPVDSLSMGIGREGLPPLDFLPMARECAFIREALLTGGKDYGQPLWNLTTLVATWLENGHALAHKMGNRHPGYDPGSTDALWDRKTRERHERNLGWPSCSAVQAAGCSSCAVCPHFVKGKSPLSLATPVAPKVTAAVSATVGPPTGLPDGFQLDADGYVCKRVTQRQKDGPPIAELKRLFTCRLTSPWTQADPPALNFTTTVDKGNTRAVSVPQEIIMSFELQRQLAKQRVKVYPPNQAMVQEFLMAWLTKLDDAQKRIESVPFGWWWEGGERRGFAYGGIIMKDDGTQQPAGFGDSVISKLYRPCGDLSHWLAAAKVVTDQKRPELDIILATGFAAPLMVTPAQYSGLISVWGESGANKSSAQKVAAAVWGHPKTTRASGFATAKSFLHKMGVIRNLPVFWDEIQDEKTLDHVFDMVLVSGQGAEGSRLFSNITQREGGEWQTVLTISSNKCFMDHVVKRQPDTNAGLYRVFEYHIAKTDEAAAGKINQIDAERVISKLEQNFGMMGMNYAKLLASDPKGVDQITLNICNAFASRVQQKGPERFWVAACGTVLAGAHFANLLGCQLDVAAMEDFMVSTYEDLRARLVAESTEGGSRTNTEDTLTGFIKRHANSQLWTGGLRRWHGAPPPGAVTLIQAPAVTNGGALVRAVEVHWLVDHRVLRISRAKFNHYVDETKNSKAAVWKGLDSHYGARVFRGTLGAGTGWPMGQEFLIEIPVPPGSPLEPQLQAHSRAQDGGAESAIAEETGITAAVNGAPPDTLGTAMAQAQKDLDLVRQAQT